jgi:hypothetical protein
VLIVSHHGEAVDNKNHFAGGRRIEYMEALLAISTLPPGVSGVLKAFFLVLELLVIGAGIYVFRKREKLFGYKGKEGDTYASANLRLAMVVLIWVHAVIFGALMIFRV